MTVGELKSVLDGVSEDTKVLLLPSESSSPLMDGEELQWAFSVQGIGTDTLVCLR